MHGVFDSEMGYDRCQHKDHDSNRTKFNKKDILVDEHDSERDFKDTHKISKPIRVIVRSKFCNDIIVTDNPDKKDWRENQYFDNFY